MNVTPEVVHLNPKHPVEVREGRVGVLHQVRVVVGHDPPQELALGIRLRLDHVPAVVTVEEELPALRVTYELDKVVVAAYAQHKVSSLDAKHGADLGKYLWRGEFARRSP